MSKRKAQSDSEDLQRQIKELKEENCHLKAENADLSAIVMERREPYDSMEICCGKSKSLAYMHMETISHNPFRDILHIDLTNLSRESSLYGSVYECTARWNEVNGWHGNSIAGGGHISITACKDHPDIEGRPAPLRYVPCFIDAQVKFVTQEHISFWYTLGIKEIVISGMACLDQCCYSDNISTPIEQITLKITDNRTEELGTVFYHKQLSSWRLAIIVSLEPRTVQFIDEYDHEPIELDASVDDMIFPCRIIWKYNHSSFPSSKKGYVPDLVDWKVSMYWFERLSYSAKQLMDEFEEDCNEHEDAEEDEQENKKVAVLDDLHSRLDDNIATENGTTDLEADQSYKHCLLYYGDDDEISIAPYGDDEYDSTDTANIHKIEMRVVTPIQKRRSRTFEESILERGSFDWPGHCELHGYWSQQQAQQKDQKVMNISVNVGFE